jgi:TetR/AcrR family transcriptional regulator, fatty acid metabolism regulator protein
VARKSSRALELSVEDQRREQILTAAVACVDEAGLERVTMRKVAQRAGVSPGTLSYYFKNKKQMLDAALMEATKRYMDQWYSQERTHGPLALDEFIDKFLGPNNASASFVLQMIQAGLTNRELRAAHTEMVDAGRQLIEQSLRVGMEVGQYRNDIDPKLAAAMIHSLMIWWGSELAGDATPRELATQVCKLALVLLDASGGRPTEPTKQLKAIGSRNGHPSPAVSTTDLIRAHLMADESLDSNAASALSEAFEKLYDVLSSADDQQRATLPAT